MKRRGVFRVGGWIVLSLLVGLATVHIAKSQRVSAASPARGEVSGFMPWLTFENQGPAPATRRLMVVTKGPVTVGMLARLRRYATILGVIPRYNLVAVTPKGATARLAITRLSFVAKVETDRVRYLTDVGSWDRDVLNVVDVEESGEVGDPDPREVAQTGAGVHVALIDTGLIKDWRLFLDPSRVRTDLARAILGGGGAAEEFVPPAPAWCKPMPPWRRHRRRTLSPASEPPWS